MKLLTEKSKSSLLILLALSLPASAVTYWSSSSSVEHSTYSVEIGSANYASSYSLAVGFGNSVNGYSLGVGQYLNSPGSYSLVVGRYNASASGAYLVVGNGTSSGARKNALEVYSN